MAEPTDRDLEQARELRRKLEQHSGDGLCYCAACEDITAMHIAAARTEGALETVRLLRGALGRKLPVRDVLDNIELVLVQGTTQDTTGGKP